MNLKHAKKLRKAAKFLSAHEFNVRFIYKELKKAIPKPPYARTRT